MTTTLVRQILINHLAKDLPKVTSQEVQPIVEGLNRTLGALFEDNQQLRKNKPTPTDPGIKPQLR